MHERSYVKVGTTSLLLFMILAYFADFSWLAMSYSLVYLAVVYCNRIEQKGYQLVRGFLFIGLTAALLLHQIPGFNNFQVYQDLKLAEDSVTYSLYINFDKLLIATVLLPYVLVRDKRIASEQAKLPPIQFPYFGSTFSALTLSPIVLVFLIAITGVVLTFSSTMLLGLVQWQLKLPPEPLIFFSKMLLITVIAEECIFRGMLQNAVTQRYGLVGVFVISGLFFGAVHIGFSPLFAIVSAIAGMAYGLVYYYSRNIFYPIALHFVVNTIHVLCFSYPMLA